MQRQISARNQPRISCACARVMRGCTGGTGVAISGALTSNRTRRDGGCTAILPSGASAVGGGGGGGGDAPGAVVVWPGTSGESAQCDADESNGDAGTSCLIGTDGDDGTEWSFGVSVQLRQCRRMLLLTLNVFRHLLHA